MSAVDSNHTLHNRFYSSIPRKLLHSWSGIKTRQDPDSLLTSLSLINAIPTLSYAMLWLFLITAVWAFNIPRSLLGQDRDVAVKYAVEQYALNSARLKEIIPRCAEIDNATSSYDFTGSDHIVYLESIAGVNVRIVDQMGIPVGLDNKEDYPELARKMDRYRRCLRHSGASFVFAFTRHADEVVSDTPDSWALGAAKIVDMLLSEPDFGNSDYQEF